MFSTIMSVMHCHGSVIASRAGVPRSLRRRIGSSVLALCLSAVSPALSADSAPKTRLIVGSELDFPPFALVRADGRADGFTAELWEAVAREARLDATIKTGPFHQLLDQFKNGEIDVLINLAQSDERRRFADFSVPHVKMAGAVFTRKGNNRIKSEEDLARQSLIVIKADLAHDYARMRGWSNLTLVDTAASGMKLLATSTKHDAMLVGRLVGLNTIRELKLANIQPLRLKVGFQQDFAFAVREGSAKLLARINDGLANVRASGAYDAIYAKWFGRLEPAPLTMESILKYLVPAVGLILLLLLAYLHERRLRVRWKNTAAALDATITERMQAETALRVSEERFQAFMDRSPAIAFIKDELGRYVYVNKTWEDLYTVDWRGKTDAELWPRDNVELFAASDRRALEAGHATEAFETVLDKNGRPQDWWVLKFPIVDADGRRLLGGIAMDLRELKAAEQALLASETKLRRITDTIPGAVYQYQLSADGTQKYISISDGIQEILGHSAAAVVDDFSLLWNAVLAEDQAALSASILRSAQTMLPWEFEGRIRLSDQSIKWIRGHAVPEPRRADGSIVWNGIVTDITERRRNEIEVDRLAAIVENLGDAIISRDFDFRILTFNAAAERLLGYGADEVIGKTSDIFIPQDNFAIVAQRRSLIHQGIQSPAADSVWLRRDGQRIDVSVTQSPIKDASSKVVGVSLSLRDITERKRMEKSLRLTQFSMDRAVDGIFWILPSAEIVYANDAACRILGYGREELIGKTVPDIDPSFPADVWPAHWQDLKQNGSLKFESTHRTKDGRPLTTELTVNYIVYEGEEYNCAIMRDITDRKQIEEALRRRDRQLVEAERIGQMGSWELDRLTNRLEWSDEIFRIFEIDPTRLGASYQAFLNLVHPDDRQSVDQAFSDSERDRAPYQITHRLLLADGRVKWVEERGETFYDDDRRALRSVGSVLDITARKLAEEALRRIEQHLVDAQAIAQLGSWEWDFQTGRNTWSDEHYRLLGYEPGSVASNYDSWVNRIHPGDRSRVQEHLRLAFNGTTHCDIEFRVMHPNGEIRFVHWRGELFRDASGNELRMAGTVLDITERKRAEEALRQAYEELERRVEERTAELQQAVATLKKTEALLHQAVDVANLGIFERDHDSDEVNYSPTLRRILALPEDRKGSLGEFMAKIHPEDRATVIAAQRSRERAGDGQFSLECRLIRSDGNFGWIMIRAQVFFEGSGDGRRPVRTVGAVLDITERKRAEEALRKLTEDLDRRVVERTRELAESQSRLRSLVAEITKTEERERRRLAVELHDYLAQMLTVSRMSIGRAEKLAANDALKQRLAEAMESVDETIAYTRSLMAQLSPRMLYELGLPAALTWLAAQQQERHGLKIEIGGAAEGFVLDEECSVLAYQCVRELLWNIVKHAQANQALVSYKIERCKLTIEVADDGQGFDVESLHASGNGVEKFGLFSIRERLELSGGKLEVTSQAGRGTKVRFTLPAPPSEMAPAVARGAVPTRAVLGTGKQLRIALVDDHTVVRRGMRQMIEEYADLTVVGEANDGSAGVELAREFRPDVVVMDVNMPRMNGIEATKLILQEMPSTIVVGLSFDNGAEVAQKMIAAGAFTCVTKERAAEDIHQAIVDAVEERRGVVAD